MELERVMKRKIKELSTPKEIEKDIPIPFGRNRYTSNHVPEMKVGDSVFYEHIDGRSKQSLQAYAYNLHKTFAERNKDYNYWKFTCRQMENGVRVWRIK
ncbi:hypothetical protein [Flagellimonas sp. CMM7]|uniref:hypothetical protein n=1 Tax=Flagellimonas sp. CMM7 TaxID=2654676 RepID=UPI0013D8A456|nr:hypothetical protein [Flagellimonas sp. CMM7]UII80015.1 hypothetical protein LV704_00490 [Flagellimonas sp. CMM7]